MGRFWNWSMTTQSSASDIIVLIDLCDVPISCTGRDRYFPRNRVPSQENRHQTGLPGWPVKDVVRIEKTIIITMTHLGIHSLNLDVHWLLIIS
jgi:hypothetical protein